MVGIISHVTELKEQIDRKLVVSRTDKGSGGCVDGMNVIIGNRHN